MPFRDRVDAGRRLAAALSPLRSSNPVVVGLPRGGVPVAAEVARALGAPLDVLVVRKVGHPLQPELGIGAISEGGATVLNHELIDRLKVPPASIRLVADRERIELARRVARYRGDRPRRPVAGRTVIVVDDGLATGYTARAAIEDLRMAGAAKVVLAIPVAPADAISVLRSLADEVVCVETPSAFDAVGRWYQDFATVHDADVLRALAGPGALLAGPEQAAEAEVEEEVEVDGGVGRPVLPGTLAVPVGARGLVLFAHGSGSSRSSPRNRAVARALNRAGLATLLFDLLTEAEAADRRNVFHVGLLAQRLVAATAWGRERDVPGHVGFFGASTGAGAALLAAAELGRGVEAVVSRGGRPDLAGDRLAAVRAPTLLIVGGQDRQVLELNRAAAKQLMACDHRIVVVPGATHLFEEPGAMEAVSRVATGWFMSHLGTSRQTTMTSSA